MLSNLILGLPVVVANIVSVLRMLYDVVAWLEDSATLESDASAMPGGTGEGRIKLPS
jgi:hypothetical protein